MWLRSRLALGLVALMPSWAALGQQASVSQVRLEAYLESLGLHELLVTSLRERLPRAEGEEHRAIAARMGAIYVDLLERAESEEEVSRWVEEGLALVDQMTFDASRELRLSLAKIRYMRAEAIAERHRVRFADEEDVAAAIVTFDEVSREFRDVGVSADRDVERLERIERTFASADPDETSALLREARRIRSLAMYYAGWSHYYLAFLTGRGDAASNSLREFGFLLNAPSGKAAVPDRVPRQMLKYDHVARAAMGCALASSIRGRDLEAESWLDTLDSAEGLSLAVTEQVFLRRLVVLTEGRKWAALDQLIRRKRFPGGGGEGREAIPLSTGAARLLAVLMLEAAQDTSQRTLHVQIVRSLAEIALADLIAQDEAGQVFDLLSRYGSVPLPGSGFAATYARSLHEYEQVREAHDGDADAPARDPALRQRYMGIRDRLDASLAGGGRELGRERARARIVAGMCSFYGGEPEDGVARLRSVYQDALGEGSVMSEGEEALWRAVSIRSHVAMNGGVEERSKRDALAATYVRAFPESDRAAKLLLSSETRDVVSDAEAAQVLLSAGSVSGEDADSALADAARARAVQLLYRAYRSAVGDERTLLAREFAESAERQLEIEARAFVTATDSLERREAAATLVVRVRQMCDVLLDGPVVDGVRAAEALQVLRDHWEAVALTEDSADVEGELAYRELQIAIAQGDDAARARLVESLHARGGAFAVAADRLLFREAVAGWRNAPGDSAAARELVERGVRVIEDEDTGRTLSAGLAGVMDRVAEAAAGLWESEQDAAMRDEALALSDRLARAGYGSAEVVRRQARLREAAGAEEAALEEWRTLLSGSAEGTAAWFEARYHTIRLLIGLDIVRAREVMQQHRVLHPEYGPGAWAERFADLDAQLQALPGGGEGDG